MHDTSMAGPVDWLDFSSPDGKDYFRVNLSFLTSHWKCRYGIGCPGTVTKKDKYQAPDMGCCKHGFYATDKEEVEEIDRRTEQLTDEDWDAELRAIYEFRGTWKVKNSLKSFTTGGEFGGCIFANRADGSVGKTGKTGCAFLHMGNRLNEGRNDLNNNSEEHHNFMPRVCWMLPLYMIPQDDGTKVINAWSNDVWTGGKPRDDDGSSDSVHVWWCVDDKESYINAQPLYLSMERELRELMGDPSYELLCRLIDDRGLANVHPFPASPEGRQLIKVLGMPEPPDETVATQVGDRPVKRPMP